jgi:putative protein-disulfide isomerase
MTATLHYIYDPLCGWCYGAEPLAAGAATVMGLELKLHGGGLWPTPTQLPEATRRYIQQADARIAQMSGQTFGDAYLNGLLLDPELVLDSRPTIAAVLAAESIDPSKTFSMVQGIQRSHYIEGRHVVELEVLLDIAAACGFDREAFAAKLAQTDPTQHIEATRRLMQQIGAGGFPTFALERDGRLSDVPHNRFARNVDGFRQWLAEQIKTVVH